MQTCDERAGLFFALCPLLLRGLASTAVKVPQFDGANLMQVHPVSALCSLVCPLVAVQRAKRFGSAWNLELSLSGKGAQI